MPIFDETADKLVRQFAKGLQDLDLELIAYILDPELRFLYREPGDRGAGLTTDVRYIGHLYKTFNSMKKEGKNINLELCFMSKDAMRYTGIILKPPHDSRIIFPLYTSRPASDLEYFLTTDDRFMVFKIINEKITKIECYSPREFAFRVGAIVS